MSGFGVGEEAGESAVAGYGETTAVDMIDMPDTIEVIDMVGETAPVDPAPDAAAVDLAGDAEAAADVADDRELVEEYPEADPQEWISGLIAALERAEQGIGSGPRDVLMARIKLAQAYSELGDTAQAAPLAVQNVAQAEQLFPSSEGMLRQLREFRDAACEAAGWTAAMMREPEGMPAPVEEGPSELVTLPRSEAGTPEAAAPDAVAHANGQPWPQPEAADAGALEAAEAEPWPTAEAEVAAEAVPEAAARADAQSWAEAEATAHTGAQPWPADAEAAAHANAQPWPGTEPAAAEARPWPEAEAVAEAWPAVGATEGEEMVLGHGAAIEAEPEGAVIHEFVRRAPEPEPAPWSVPAAPQPAELAIPTPPEPEYAEEVAPAVPAADLAAFEEIVRLRYQLREAQRTIERLKHVNRKLREALEFEAE